MFLAILGLMVGGSAGALTVTIAGADCPQVGKKLVATADEENCTFVWRRGATDKNGETLPEATPVSTAAGYVPTEADYEHWLLVTATKGSTRATAKIWFSRLPVIYIDLKGGVQEETALHKEVNQRAYHKASIRIQGNAEFAEQYNGGAQIKGRGNTSWLFYAQKPYKIKLDAKADLFGFGKGKHWVLISNNSDNAMVRNRLASDLAKELGIVGMDMTWTPCILNGRFHGVYMLCEHIRIDPNRVDIFNWEGYGEELADRLAAAAGLSPDAKNALEKQMATDLSWVTTGSVSFNGKTCDLRKMNLVTDDLDTSGGFLFELDRRDDRANRGPTAEPRFATEKGSVYYHYTEPQLGYRDVTLSNAAVRIWKDYEDAMMAYDGYTKERTPRHFTEFVDLDSMAAFYLVNEVLGNMDAAAFSRYAYKNPGRKLAFGPVWDFDLGSYSPFFGGTRTSVSYGKNAQPDAWAFSSKYTEFDNFMMDWLNDPIFCLRAVQLYRERVRPWLDRLVAENGTLDRYHDLIAGAGASHDIMYGHNATVVAGTETGFGGFENDTRNFRGFMTSRRAWLDRQFAYGQGLMTGVMMFMQSTRNWHKHDAKNCRVVLHDKDDGSRLEMKVAEDGRSVAVAVKEKRIRLARVYVNGLYLQDLTTAATVAITDDMIRNAVGGVVLVEVDGFASATECSNSTFSARNFVLIEGLTAPARE